VAFIAASSMALRAVSCSLAMLWEATACPSFCLLSFSRYPCTLCPYGDMFGTSQKFRPSFVTNSCTVCNLSWFLVGYPPNNGDSFNLKLPSPTHTNSEISRVTHPPCLLRDCYWPSSKRPVNHHRILPPSSLACARSKRESVSQPPYLQRVVGTFTSIPLSLPYPSTCYDNPCISPA
jgi:hypothetical protein